MQPGCTMKWSKQIAILALGAVVWGSCAPDNAPSAPASQAKHLYLEALLDFERHADSIWRDVSGPDRPANAGYWGDGGSQGNGGIRGSCGVAVAIAVIVHARPDDPDNSNRIARVTRALNYAANTHVSGDKTCIDGRKWGHDWQTAEWAGSMGLACLLLEKHLPAETVSAVKRAIADESDYRAGVPPASGYVGDTKSEENGWNSNVLALSAAWMRDHPNATNWLEAAKRHLVNTYTIANTNGNPLAPWISTVTLYPSYALENHQFYHPTYAMVGGMSLGDSLIMARLGNPEVARELEPFAEHNVLPLWTNNLQYMLTDSSDFAYPSGLDWELHDYEHNSYLTWLATHFNDPVARWAQERIAVLVRERQKINGDGRFVGPSVRNGFFREAVEARRTAIAWLFLEYAKFPEGPQTPPGTAVVYFPDVKIIAHRSPAGFFGLSFGRRIMGFLEPAVPPDGFPTNVFLTSPRLPAMLGLGALGAPTAAELLSFSTNASGFDAQLKLEHDTNGTTDVRVRSAGGVVAMLEVPHPAPNPRLASMGSFSVGIENDPLTGGTRLLEWDGGSVVITNRSGAFQAISNSWVCVAGRYGMAAGPAGFFTYEAPTRYNRSGGAEDTLQFFPSERLGPRYAVWFLNRSTEEVAKLASRIRWNVSDSRATLEFPLPNGESSTLSASIP